jgi:hypothetical protein
MTANLDETLRAMVREIVREELAATHEVHAPSPAPVEYVSAQQLSTMIGLSVEALKQMRKRGDGPPFVRVARRAVRYSVSEAKAWLADQTRGKTSGH